MEPRLTKDGRLHPIHRRPRLPKHVQPGVIGELTRARVQRGLSVAVLAKTTGYDKTSIQRWEHGSVCPAFICVIDWAQALGFELCLKRPDDKFNN